MAFEGLDADEADDDVFVFFFFISFFFLFFFLFFLFLFFFFLFFTILFFSSFLFLLLLVLLVISIIISFNLPFLFFGWRMLTITQIQKQRHNCHPFSKYKPSRHLRRLPNIYPMSLSTYQKALSIGRPATTCYNI